MVEKTPTSFLQVPTQPERKTLKCNMKASSDTEITRYLRPGLIQVNENLQRTTALSLVNNGLFVVTEGVCVCAVLSSLYLLWLMQPPGVVGVPQGSPKESKAAPRMLYLQEQWTLETNMAMEPTSPQL